MTIFTYKILKLNNFKSIFNNLILFTLFLRNYQI